MHEQIVNKDCSNCLNDTCSSDEEPCFNCIHNPQTQIDDNWAQYTLPRDVKK